MQNTHSHHRLDLLSTEREDLDQGLAIPVEKKMGNEIKKINMSTKREEVAQSDMSDTENFFLQTTAHRHKGKLQNLLEGNFFFFQGFLVPSLQNVLFKLFYLEKDYLFVTQ